MPLFSPAVLHPALDCGIGRAVSNMAPAPAEMAGRPTLKKNQELAQLNWKAEKLLRLGISDIEPQNARIAWLKCQIEA